MPEIKGKSTLRNKTVIHFEKLYKAAMQIRALNHQLRRSMLELIDKNQDMVVTEIYATLRLEQSVASQHLAILRREGFVTTQREGKKIHYRVNHEEIKRVLALVDDMTQL